MAMKSIIQENLQHLVDCTDPNDTLINGLAMCGIIREGMRARLKAETDKGTANLDLYKFLEQSRTDEDLDKVMEFLDKSANSAALAIFKKNIHTNAEKVQEKPGGVDVDSVVAVMLDTGGSVILDEKKRIASKLGVPSHISDPWITAHMVLALRSHDLFTKILGHWVVHREQANIGRLTEVMKDMKLLAVAEAISRLGSSKTLIIQQTQ